MLTTALPDHTESPIAHLLPAVGPSLERIAPERSAQLDALTDGVTLGVTDSRRWICEASPGYRLIQLSTRVVEVAWAFSLAYWVYYQRTLAGRELTGGVVDLSGDAPLQDTLRLLDWAVEELSDGRERPWPADAPRPIPEPPFASDEHVSDEITLCALAFFLHHELAHTYLIQADDEPLLDHERACDVAAGEWVLGESSLPPLVVQKRALGIAVGLLLITARGIHTGDHDGVNHPVDFERLTETLVRHVPAAQEAVWGMVVGVLALHTTRAQIAPPAGEFEGPTAFRDAALAHADVLRQRLTSMRQF